MKGQNMLNAITGGAGAIRLASNNTAGFAGTERRGNLALIIGGLAPKAFPMAKVTPAKRVDAPQTHTFWADRHSPSHTAGDTTNRSRVGAQPTSAVKKTEVTHPDSHDFWGQRHSI
jgi:hypothetical protein